jgi:hypothetical protein
MQVSNHANVIAATPPMMLLTQIPLCCGGRCSRSRLALRGDCHRLRRMGVLDRFRPVSLVVEHNIATRAPEMDAERGQRDIGVHDLVVAVKIEVLLRLGGVGVRVLRRGFNALCDVGEHFLRAKHAVCAESSIAVGTCNTWQEILEGLEDERKLHGFFVGNLILRVSAFSAQFGSTLHAYLQKKLAQPGRCHFLHDVGIFR